MIDTFLGDDQLLMYTSSHCLSARNQTSTLIPWVKEAEEWCIASLDIEAVIDQF